jgi:hypothetical protein
MGCLRAFAGSQTGRYNLLCEWHAHCSNASANRHSTTERNESPIPSLSEHIEDVIQATEEMNE